MEEYLRPIVRHPVIVISKFKHNIQLIENKKVIKVINQE
jgi:hypothetical protein